MLHNSNDADATTGFKVRIQPLEINNINENKTELIKNISKLIKTTTTNLNLLTTTSPNIITSTNYAKKYIAVQENTTLLPGEESKTEFYKEKTTKKLTTWPFFTFSPLVLLTESPPIISTTNKFDITEKSTNTNLGILKEYIYTITNKT